MRNVGLQDLIPRCGFADNVYRNYAQFVRFIFLYLLMQTSLVYAERLDIKNNIIVNNYKDYPRRSWPQCQYDRLRLQAIALSSFSQRDVNDLIKKAANNDAEAIYVLSRILKRRDDGELDVDFIKFWRERAVQSGHPIARYLYTLPENQSDDERILMAEKAAVHGEESDIALSLGIAHAYPEDPPIGFEYIKNRNPEKSRQWLTFSAERGNQEAAYRLCSAYHYGNEHYGIQKNYRSAQKWCVRVAFSACASGAPAILSDMYKTGGYGLPKDLIESNYWLQIYTENKK